LVSLCKQCTFNYIITFLCEIINFILYTLNWSVNIDIE
jgi:hypothetical protein